MSNSKLRSSLIRAIDATNTSMESDVKEAIEPESKVDESEKLCHPLDDEMDGVEGSKEQVQQPPKLEKIKVQKRRFNFLGSVSMVLSSFAIGAVGYVAVQHEQFKSVFHTHMANLSLSLEDINHRADEVSLMIKKTNEQVEKHTGLFSGVNKTRQDIILIQERIQDIQADLAKVKASAGVNYESITGLQRDLELMQGEIIKTRSVSKQSNESLSKPKPLLQPIPKSEPDSIDGTYVAAIDIWGGSSDVMMRDVSGNWFPLTVGDQYKSWTLVRIMDTQALFQSGSQTKTLVVRDQ